MPSLYLSAPNTPLPLSQLDDRAFRDLFTTTKVRNTSNDPLRPVDGVNEEVFQFLSAARDGKLTAPTLEELTAEYQRRLTLQQELRGGILGRGQEDYRRAVRGDYHQIAPAGPNRNPPLDVGEPIPVPPGHEGPLTREWSQDWGPSSVWSRAGLQGPPAPNPPEQSPDAYWRPPGPAAVPPTMPAALPDPAAPAPSLQAPPTVAVPPTAAVPAPAPAPAPAPVPAPVPVPAPAVDPAATPTVGPAPPPSPVEAAFAPPPDPFHRQVVTRFETGGLPNPEAATNPNSSAFGATQITRGRYNDLRTRYGAANPWMPRTFEEFKQAGGAMEQRIYNEVHGPDTVRALSDAGLPNTPTAFLATHFLGNNGGPRLMRAYESSPGDPVTRHVKPDQVGPNRSVFFDKDGKERTVAETIEEINRRSGAGGGGALNAGAGTATPSGQPGAAASLMQPVASATGGGLPNQEGAEANPYRAKMAAVLEKMAADRDKKPTWGDVLFRMGTGMLSPKASTFGAGLAEGGKLTADYFDQHRAGQLATDRTLVSGYNALANDRTSAFANRDRVRNTNLQWRDANGTLQYGASRVSNGNYELMDRDGQWKPAFQVAGTHDFQEANRSADNPFAEGPGGIPGAGYVNPVTGEPVFTFTREGNEKSYTYATTGIYAAQKMAEMERAGYNPTNMQAIAARIASNPDGRLDPTQILNTFSDPKDRQYAGYLLAYTNAVARQQSGAAIGVGEWQRYGGMFAGFVGDDPETRQMRMRLREEHLRGLIGSSGPAAPYLQDVWSGKRSLPSMAYREPAGGGSGAATSTPAAAASTSTPEAAPTPEAPQGIPLAPDAFKGTAASIRATAMGLDPRKTYIYNGTPIPGQRLRDIMLDKLRAQEAR